MTHEPLRNGAYAGGLDGQRHRFHPCASICQANACLSYTTRTDSETGPFGRSPTFRIRRSQSASSTDLSAFDQTKNQIKSSLGFQYDPSGNLTADPTTGANAILYDAESRQTSYTKSTTTTYGYDGQGRRVTKTVAGSSTVFVYNVAGQLITEYGGSPANGGVSYLTTDHLGSTRVVTDKNQAVVARHDYLAFGEEIPAGIGNRTAGGGYVTTDDTTQRFAQKERDSESGLDYFGARYYASAQGRFTSYDPIFLTALRAVDPQRLNLYAYARNNPLKFVDPNGTDVAITAKNLEEAQKLFNVFLEGLKAEDRSHVHLSVGDGTHGYQKGQFYILVDKDYKSASGNFQAVQHAANDRTALGKITVVHQGDEVKLRNTELNKGHSVLVLASFSFNNEFDGYTFFQYRGKEYGTAFSAGEYTESYIKGDQDEVEVSATMHHELRAHMVLGDFGRNVPQARHSDAYARGQGPPASEADKVGEEAEKEAKQNAAKTP